MADDAIVRGFDEIATTYLDTSPLAARLVSHARVQAGERVLDVGCGPGAASILLRDAGASVVGIDRAPGMLARAARQVPVARADALVLPFADDTFDLVVASSVIQFTGPRSLPEWRRVGRRVACSLPHGPETWRSVCAEFVDRTTEPYRSYAVDVLARSARRPDPERIRARLGFSSVRDDAMPIVRTYASADDAFESERLHGARAFIDALEPDALPAFRAAYAASVTQPDGTAEIRHEFLFWCFE